MKFEKTYLSRAMTKTMSLDHPIGDPFGGPAYGERRDPVSAAISIYSMYGAGVAVAGAMTAGATFGAAVAGLSIAQGLMFAGGALSLVGNVTGNNDLMVLGTALTIGGGIGGYMSDAGTGFNQTFSEAFTPTPDASTAANALTNAPAANATPAPASGNLAEGGVNPAETTLKEATSGTNNVATNLNTPPPVASPVTSANLDTAVNPSYNLQDMARPMAPAAPGLEGNAASGIKMPGATPANPISINTATAPTGLIDEALSFAKVNPMAAMVLGQAGSGVATGVMDMATGKSAAQKDQLTADAAYRNSVADKTNRDTALQAARVAQLNANLKAQFNTPQVNVNPNAVTMTQPPGLIAGARA
jgi:hypothetical protein